MNYSTEEQIVGTYHGKPLYQKDIVLDSATLATINNLFVGKRGGYATDISHGIADIDKVRISDAFCCIAGEQEISYNYIRLDNIQLMYRWFISRSDLKFRYYASYANTDGYEYVSFTLQYTKTTD